MNQVAKKEKEKQERCLSLSVLARIGGIIKKIKSFVF